MLKPLYWVGSAKDDLMAFPEEVREEAGYVLFCAQQGDRHTSVKPLKGFKGAGVLEIVENHDTNTFNANQGQSLC